jgi:hypothetical protein
MHPLDGAHERVSRAQKHLADLRERIDILCKNKVDSVTVNRQRIKLAMKDGTERYGILGSVTVPTDPLPLILAILVGEIIYNLRASLDYLVYELACFDSKQVVEGTQFPIENNPKTFRNRIGTVNDKRNRGVFLRGLSDVHATAIDDSTLQAMRMD